MSTLSTFRFDVSDFEKLYLTGILRKMIGSIVDPINREVQGFRELDAVAGLYGKAMRMNSDGVIHPAAFSDIKIRLSEFFA
jgi:hypothetical protein